VTRRFQLTFGCTCFQKLNYFCSCNAAEYSAVIFRLVSTKLLEVGFTLVPQQEYISTSPIYHNVCTCCSSLLRSSCRRRPEYEDGDPSGGVRSISFSTYRWCLPSLSGTPCKQQARFQVGDNSSVRSNYNSGTTPLTPRPIRGGGLPGADTYVAPSLNHASCNITTSGVFSSFPFMPHY